MCGGCHGTHCLAHVRASENDAQARKFAKPEVKELVEEWYDLLMSTQVPEEGEEVEGGEGDETAAVDLEEEINALEITESDVEEEEED